jgi:hypothetical protein
VTSIRRELGKPVDLNAVKSPLREAFESHLEVKLTGDESTNFESALGQRLERSMVLGATYLSYDMDVWGLRGQVYR